MPHHILLLGSKTFAEATAALLHSCRDIEPRHATHVSIEMFLATWRPDCAIINCCDLAQDAPYEIETLRRLQPNLNIVLITSQPVSHPGTCDGAAVLHPSEVDQLLAVLLASLCEVALTV